MKTGNRKTALLLGALMNMVFLANNAAAATTWTQEMVNGLFKVHKENSSFVNDSFAGTKMTGLLVSGSNFTGANFTGTSIDIADFTNTTLTGAVFSNTLLASVDFTGSNLTLAQLQSTQNWANKKMGRVYLNGLNFNSGDFSGMDFSGAQLKNTQLKNANLTGAKLTTVQLNGANLAGANLTNATFDTRLDYYTDMVITGANLTDVQKHGFTQAHLEKTASWKNKTLGSVILDHNTMTGWDFSGQDMVGASISSSASTSTNFSGANLSGANLTSSYFDNADFSNANLSNAKFDDITRLTDATIAGAILSDTVVNGFTEKHMYSTKSYKDGNLQGINLSRNSMKGWNYSGKDLSGGNLSSVDFSTANFAGADLETVNLTHSYLTNADLTNANLSNATFDDVTRLNGAIIAGANLTNVQKKGFTQAHLESTASWKNKALGAVTLNNNTMTEWNFSGQDMAGASISSAVATSVNFSGANLTGANLTRSYFDNADFTNANLENAKFDNITRLTNATIAGADLSSATKNGFTQTHLESTASWKNKMLGAVIFDYSTANGWNFSGQNMSGSSFQNFTGMETDFSGADFTRAKLSGYFDKSNFTGTNFTNATFGQMRLTDAIIAGADFSNATKNGFTKEYLYATGSWKNKSLGAIVFDYNTASEWDFSGQEMSGASFQNFTGIGTNFSGANLTGANLARSYLDNADFTNANLTNVTFDDVTRLTDAIIAGANLSFAQRHGFTQKHLESTASWKNKMLGAITLNNNYIDEWDFSGQDMTGSTITAVTALSTNFSGANLTRANLSNSYFDNADFTNANLTNATFSDKTRLTDAIIAGANLTNVTKIGFTQAHLESTASWKNKELGAITLNNTTVSEWNFSGQNMTGASLRQTTARSTDFSGADLSKADLTSSYFDGSDFTDANLTNAVFDDVTRLHDAVIAGANLTNVQKKGFTQAHLESTASWKNKALGNVILNNNHMQGWNFSGQNMTGATISSAVATSANFSGANLTEADLTRSYFDSADFSNANFTNAKFDSITRLTDINISGANLTNVTSGGFLEKHLAATLNYKNKNLQGINFSRNNFSNWDFSSQNLRNSNFTGTTVTGANFDGADLRGAQGLVFDSAISLSGGRMYGNGGIYENTLGPDGTILGFKMDSKDDSWTVTYWDENPVVKISSQSGNAVMSNGAVLTVESGVDLRITAPLTINTDINSSTQIVFEGDAILTMGDGFSLTANVLGDFEIGEEITFDVMTWTADATIVGSDLLEKDRNIMLNVNGSAFNGTWDYIVGTDGLSISFVMGAVPEPATYAVIFGVTALILAASGRRKRVI